MVAELPKVFFIRVMKAGSMTLAQLLRERYAPEATYPGPEVKTLALAIESAAPAYLAGLPREHVRKLRLVAHHLPFAARSLLEGEFLTCAFFRDPVSRIISHLQSELHAVPEGTKQRALLESLYDKPNLIDRDNMMLRQFAMTPQDMRSIFGQYALDDGALRRAVANFEQLDFIGLFDDYEGDVHRFGAIVGVDFRQIPKMNASKARTIEPTLRRKIEERNAADLEFYDKVRRIYAERGQPR